VVLASEEAFIAVDALLRVHISGIPVLAVESGLVFDGRAVAIVAPNVTTVATTAEHFVLVDWFL
jgi:hypothetical protein